MKYLLKTFFPLPLYKSCFDEVQDLVDKLEYILDYTQEFYRQRGTDVDLDRYIEMSDGYRVMLIDENKMEDKLKKFVLRDMPMTFTKPMYEFEKYRGCNG